MRWPLSLLLLVFASGWMPASARTWLDWSSHGWDGHFRQGQSVPVIAQVRHSGPAAQLRIELRGGGGRILATQQFLAADQTSRRVEFVLPAPGPERLWALHLLVDGQQVLVRLLVWRRLRASHKLVVALGLPPQTLLPHLIRLNLVYIRPPLARLPRRWGGWQAVDLCLLAQPEGLAPRVRTALQRWILSGGRAVAFLSRQPEKVTEQLGPLLPWRLAERLRVESASLMHWLGVVGQPGQRIASVRGHSPPRQLLAGTVAAPLIGYQPAGRGGTLTLHFQPADVPGLLAQDGQAFWERILRHRQQPVEGLRHAVAELCRATPRTPLGQAFAGLLRAQGRTRLPYGSLLCFVALYLLVLGPLTLLVHRRRGPAWGMSVVALSVGLFVLVAVFWGRQLPSAGPRQLTLSVIDVGPGWRIDRRLSGLHRFRDAEQLTFRFDSDRDQVEPIRLQWRRFDQDDAGVGVVTAIGGRELKTLAPILLALQRPTTGTGKQVGMQAVYSCSLSQATVALRFRDPLDGPLRDALLVTATTVYPLPDLAAGARSARSQTGVPLIDWLATARRVRQPSLRQALIQQSFRRALVQAPRGFWDLSEVLRRGDAVLLGRLDRLEPALSFPGLAVTRTDLVFVRAIVPRDAR